MNVEKIVSDVIDFVVYVEEFYGKGGIYDMGATSKQILEVHNNTSLKVRLSSVEIVLTERKFVI